MKFTKKRVVYGLIALAVIAAAGYFLVFNKNSKPENTAKVTKGSISETVLVTGSTSPVQSVSLSFGSNGIVSGTFGAVGKTTFPGQVLARVNMGDLSGQIQQAQANVAAEEAMLSGLKSGARPQDIAGAQAALDKANQDLRNLYSNIIETATDSFAKADDAVRTQLHDFFSNADSQSPALTYETSYSQEKSNAQIQRQLATTYLNEWQGKLKNIDTSDAGLANLAQKNISYLASIRELLQSLSVTLYNAPTLSSSTLAAYKASVTNALTQINTAQKNLESALQTIASQKNTVAQLQAQLELKQAGSSQQDIATQEARLQNAKAALQSAYARAVNLQIASPIAGIITQFDAKVGQWAGAGTPLVSIISDKKFEIDSAIPETDIGKLAVGDKVAMTFDAFGSETFQGTLFYIDPAETISQGVVDYKIKVSLDTTDARIKSGLTANLQIETKHKDNVLMLPQYTILQNDQGTFVQIMDNGKRKDIPVVLGIQDKNGNVEIISGVTEGQEVLSIGLK